jgi:hypothetical protein
MKMLKISLKKCPVGVDKGKMLPVFLSQLISSNDRWLIMFDISVFSRKLSNHQVQLFYSHLIHLHIKMLLENVNSQIVGMKKIQILLERFPIKIIWLPFVRFLANNKFD